jgi:hypothetical protein
MRLLPTVNLSFLMRNFAGLACRDEHGVHVSRLKVKLCCLRGFGYQAWRLVSTPVALALWGMFGGTVKQIVGIADMLRPYSKCKVLSAVRGFGLVDSVNIGRYTTVSQQKPAGSSRVLETGDSQRFLVGVLQVLAFSEGYNAPVLQTAAAAVGPSALGQSLSTQH